MPIHGVVISIKDVDGAMFCGESVVVGEDSILPYAQSDDLITEERHNDNRRPNDLTVGFRVYVHSLAHVSVWSENWLR